jgi:pimeloyl-ACP methyl ester carboxylesterase
VIWRLVEGVHRLGLYAALATGRASWLPAPVPMRSVSTRAHATRRARCLIVFLPGIGDSDAVFAEHGFVEALRSRNLSVDTISANATIGYYARRTLRDRLEIDILKPALRLGYEKIWFAGVSMGGLGSLLVAMKYGPQLAGVILMAPYLGDDRLLTEISDAGGLATWTPAAKSDDADYPRDLWRWLKIATEVPESAPPIYLASGDQDKLAKGHRLLGARLPPARRFRTRGNHDWGPWSRLWANFLDHSDFRDSCAER